MSCSVFAGEGESWEVMVLFTDCPVVQTYRQKKKTKKKYFWNKKDIQTVLQ